MPWRLKQPCYCKRFSEGHFVSWGAPHTIGKSQRVWITWKAGKGTYYQHSSAPEAKFQMHSIRYTMCQQTRRGRFFIFYNSVLVLMVGTSIDNALLHTISCSFQDVLNGRRHLPTTTIKKKNLRWNVGAYFIKRLIWTSAQNWSIRS